MEEKRIQPGVDTGSGAASDEQPREMSRRQALAALGKLAIYTAPVLTTLTMKVDHAAAASPPPHPDLPPGFGT